MKRILQAFSIIIVAACLVSSLCFADSVPFHVKVKHNYHNYSSLENYPMSTIYVDEAAVQSTLPPQTAQADTPAPQPRLTFTTERLTAEIGPFQTIMGEIHPTCTFDADLFRDSDGNLADVDFINNFCIDAPGLIWNFDVYNGSFESDKRLMQVSVNGRFTKLSGDDIILDKFRSALSPTPISTETFHLVMQFRW